MNVFLAFLKLILHVISRFRLISLNSLQLTYYFDLQLKENEFIFHAGTKIVNDTIVSNGGRVLNIVTRSNDFKSARESSLELLKEVNWDNGFYRKDIGYKVIKE